MSEHKQKPKGKPLGRRALLFLLAGVGIGVLVTGVIVALGVALLVPVRVVSVTAPPVPIESRPTMVPFPTATPFPAGAQAAGTVVANHVNTAAISPDGNTIAVAVNVSGNTSVYLDSVQSNTLAIDQRSNPYMQSSYITDLEFSPDSIWLTAIEDERTVLLFNVENETFQRFQGFTAAAFSSDSAVLALASIENGVQLYDLTTRQIEQQPIVSSGVYVEAMDMNTQGEIALSIRDGQGSSEIWLYDGANEGTAPEMIYERSGGLFDLDFHPDGDWLAIGGMEYASLVNITNGEQSRYPIQVESVYAVDFNDDGTQLAIGGGSSGLGVPFLMAVRWDDGQPIPPDPDYYEPVTFIGHAHAIFDVQFAPSGNLLSASRDGTVRLWNAETGDMMMMAGF